MPLKALMVFSYNVNIVSNVMSFGFYKDTYSIITMNLKMF